MSKDRPPSRTAAQFIVRFPEGMREQIAEEAKKNNRSMNAEIVARLQASFATDAAEPARAPAHELREPTGLYAAELKEQMARIESVLDYLVEGIESGEVGTPGVKMSPAAAEPTPGRSKGPSVASAQPYKPGESLPRPPLPRYPKPRK